MNARTPSYRLHKPSGQAVVTLDGRDFYLGRYGTATSRAEYDRLIAEWLQNGRVLPAAADLTINEMLVGYLSHCDDYYRKPDGTPTSEPASIALSVRPLKSLYGHTLARQFGPAKLKTCREAMIDAGLCRSECNKRTRRIARAFKWAAENELVPASVWHSLRAVDGLRKGRCRARETAPVRPVPDAHIDAVVAHVLPPVAAMIQVQRLTGMRPGEVVAMTTGDVDRSGDIWLYRPKRHKTEHHGHERSIPIGPRARAILELWLKSDRDAPLFSPRDGLSQKREEMRARRKSKVQPSQRNRRKRHPKREPRDRYDAHSYYYAIRRACAKAGVPPWHPNRLRHTAATWLRKEFGIDVARVILGHRTAQVTEVYAELDRQRAIDIMAQVG